MITKFDSLTLLIYKIILADFLLQNKLKKVKFLKKNFIID